MFISLCTSNTSLNPHAKHLNKTPPTTRVYKSQYKSKVGLDLHDYDTTAIL